MAQNSINQNESTFFEKPVVLFEWSAPSRRFSQKSSAWYATLVLVTLTFFTLLIFFGQWSLGFLVLALAFAIFVWYYFEPGQASCQILNTGVKIDKEKYAYFDLRSFWFEKLAEQRILHFATYLTYPAYLSLILDTTADQEKLEQELLKKLPYHEEEVADWVGSLESFFENLAQRLPPVVVSFYEKIFGRATSALASRFSKRT